MIFIAFSPSVIFDKMTAPSSEGAYVGQGQGLSLRLCVIIGLSFFVLQKIIRVRIPLTICKKKITVQCLSHHTVILGGEQGIFRRTAVRLRIASLFNHGLSNSPPDCFHRQSRPSLFESLAVLSTKNKGYSKCYTLHFWRRARDSNPRNRFGGLHDFQSCSFDQLGQLSVSPVILYTIV